MVRPACAAQRDVGRCVHCDTGGHIRARLGHDLAAPLPGRQLLPDGVRSVPTPSAALRASSLHDGEARQLTPHPLPSPIPLHSSARADAAVLPVPLTRVSNVAATAGSYANSTVANPILWRAPIADFDAWQYSLWLAFAYAIAALVIAVYVTVRCCPCGLTVCRGMQCKDEACLTRTRHTRREGSGRLDLDLQCHHLRLH